MKRNYLVAILIALFMAVGVINILPQTAAAHELNSDGDYYTLLHIEPNDEPQAGVPSKLKFSVNKHTDAYNQNNYVNRATISKGGKTVATLKVRQSVFGNAADGVADYTFATAGDYNIRLFGRLLPNPKEAFTINFAVRVGAGNTAATTSNKDGFGTAAKAGLAVAAVSLIGVLAYMFVPTKFNRVEVAAAADDSKPSDNGQRNRQTIVKRNRTA